jgi:Methyltransferase domain
MLHPNGVVLDIGSRSEKIRRDAVTLDIDARVRPDVCASAECLPFRTGAFEYVTMLEVIEHLENEQLQKALTESKRVGKFLVISTPNCDSKVWDRIVWPVWTHTIGREWIGAHKQFFGKKSAEDLFERDFHMEILDKNFSRWNLLFLLKTNPSRVEEEEFQESALEIEPEIGSSFRSSQ